MPAAGHRYYQSIKGRAMVAEDVACDPEDLAVAELIRATSKDELKGLLWRALFWVMRNDCLCQPDAWAAWQGYNLKEAEEERRKAGHAAKRAARKQVVGARVFRDV